MYKSLCRYIPVSKSSDSPEKEIPNYTKYWFIILWFLKEHRSVSSYLKGDIARMYTEMEGESKYHVANILSNLSNGGHAGVQVNTVRFCVFLAFIVTFMWILFIFL